MSESASESSPPLTCWRLAVRAKPKVFTKHFAQPLPATPPAAPVSGGSAGTSDGECKSDDAALEKDLYTAVFRTHRQTTVDVSDRLGSNPFAVRSSFLFRCFRTQLSVRRTVAHAHSPLNVVSCVPLLHLGCLAATATGRGR